MRPLVADFTVGLPIDPSLQLDQASYQTGKPIWVRFAAPRCFPAAFVGVVGSEAGHEGVPSDALLPGIVLLGGAESGEVELTAPLTVGSYEVRMYSTRAGGRELASAGLEVIPDPSLTYLTFDRGSRGTIEGDTLRMQGVPAGSLEDLPVGIRLLHREAPGQEPTGVEGAEIRLAAVEGSLITIRRDRLRTDAAGTGTAVDATGSRRPGSSLLKPGVVPQTVHVTSDRAANTLTIVVVGVPSKLASFEILRTTYPPRIQSGGPREDLIVEYAGEPEFPVTMTLRPRSCPSGLNCLSPTSRHATGEASNRLTGRQFLWCQGVTGAPWIADYEVLLEDNAGRQTAPMTVSATCEPE
jgi:hypothetical protein